MPPKRRKSQSAKAKVADDDAPTPQQTSLRTELDALHREMQFAQYTREKNGQLQRKVPKSVSRINTRVRKQLESQDAKESVTLSRRRSPRGSTNALDPHVVEQSRVFNVQELNDNMEEDDDDDSASFGDLDADGVVDLAGVNDGDEEVLDSEPEIENDGADVRLATAASANTSKERAAKTKAYSTLRPRKRRKLFRLRNFKSYKMAQKHGDALAAHARGMPKVAIQKLKQVAKGAPSAPQVYSSLGMIYEDMLEEIWRKQASEGSFEMLDDDAVFKEDEDQAVDVIGLVPDTRLACQLVLARKAYGSYHVAAILCRQDFSLWQRAADMALTMAEIHLQAMQGFSITEFVRGQHRSERQRWLEEAKNDYQKADNLKPPGIDTTAKLAAVLTELGHLSEALSLMTDLKNGSLSSSFESSYHIWELYANLMLKIGQECQKWNDGMQTNENFMFRRWLRKYAATFNWRERRLEALTMGLQAAAGTENCKALLHAIDTQYLGSFPSQLHRISTVSTKTAPKNHNCSLEETQRQKHLLKAQHSFELEAFDRLTTELPVQSDSVAISERNLARCDLVKLHRAAVEDLERQGDDVNRLTEEVVDAHLVDGGRTFLPSASCRVVWRIVEALQIHAVDMRLYTVGRLAGEAASLYLEYRRSLVEKRMRAQHDYDRAQREPTSVFSLSEKRYDGVQPEIDVESDEEVFSDEYDVIQSNGHHEDSLRKGTLPSQLLVLYGVCLFGEGGKVFIAVKCFSAVNSLPQESEDWLEGHNSQDGGIMTRLSGRTAAYALLADILFGSELENSMVSMVRPLFSSQYASMKGILLVAEDGFYKPKTFGSDRFARSRFLKVFLTSIRLSWEENWCTAKVEGAFDASFVNELMHQTESIVSLVQKRFIWNDCACEASLKIMLFYTLCDVTRKLSELVLTTSPWKDKAYLAMAKLVSALCGADVTDLINKSDQVVSETFTMWPFNASWLTPVHLKLALRCYHLCAATNADGVSGWEDEDVTPRLVNQPYSFNSRGLSIIEGKVVGLLSPVAEEELAGQWNVMMALIPNSQFEPFVPDNLHRSGWYQEAKARQCTSGGMDPFSAAEGFALSTMLHYSRVSLHYAEKADDKFEKETALLNSLCILLPIAQFGMNRTVWACDVGTVRKSTLSLPSIEWKKSIEHTVDDKGKQSDDPRRAESEFGPEKSLTGTALLHCAGQEPSGASIGLGIRVPVSVNPKRLPLKTSTYAALKYRATEWFESEDKESYLRNIITIPCCYLQMLWDSGNKDLHLIQDSRGQTLMRTLHTSILRIRLCYTNDAASRASLQIAAAFIQLAGIERLPYTFSCLTNAVLYASQGSRLGNNDDTFKSSLPCLHSCSPLDALTILGRAECLLSIFFCSEAIFLCKFVTAVCRERRNRANDSNAEVWNDKWKIVAFSSYNTSVAIRNAVVTMLQDRDRFNNTLTWDKETIDELENGRREGLSLQQEFAQSQRLSDVA